MEESGNNHHKKRSSYLPKLCSSTSIKGVNLPKLNHLSSSSSSSSSSFDDPSSPRVSCMGQVKKDNTLSTTKNHYKFFVATAVTRTATSHRFKGNLCRKKSTNSTTLAKGYKCNFTPPEVNISQMDPPLPVVKRVKDPGFDREEVNLWKRRSEFASKNLELSHIDIPNNCYFLPIVDNGGVFGRQREIHPSLKTVSC